MQTTQEQTTGAELSGEMPVPRRASANRLRTGPTTRISRRNLLTLLAAASVLTACDLDDLTLFADQQREAESWKTRALEALTRARTILLTGVRTGVNELHDRFPPTESFDQGGRSYFILPPPPDHPHAGLLDSLNDTMLEIGTEIEGFASAETINRTESILEAAYEALIEDGNLVVLERLTPPANGGSWVDAWWSFSS